MNKNNSVFKSQAQGNLKKRHRVSKIWRNSFFLSTTIGIFSLVILLFSIINQAFGYVIVENKVDPASLSSIPLKSLEREELISILQENLSKNRFKTIQRDNPVEELKRSELVGLVTSEIIKPTTLKSYFLIPSLTNKAEIIRTQQDEFPNAVVQFRSWISLSFLSDPLSTNPDTTGIRTALIGSLWIIVVTVIIAFPIGIGAAIYLEEYSSNNWLSRIIKTNIDNLAGIPSIVYGLLGLAIFVRGLNLITSGAFIGIDQSNGRTILSAALTMSLLILPLIIINAQEAIRAVPSSLRQASYGLGATRLQTIWYHVLPAAMPGILTGTILAVSRAIGETAPLILVGASSFINKDPSGLFSNFTVLPIQIYNWTTRPQAEFRNVAAASILVLLIVLLTLNTAAILLRNHFSKNKAA
ncbi:MAG TPA: phosphate ABC transporter permease PstA [Anaerolineaceae bacterium]|nr:phosphate ABC transporter permease PstA [Anaerolineaceae bacterium]